MSTVAIVGLAPSTRELWFEDMVISRPSTGWVRQDWDVWSLNQGHNLFSPEMMEYFTAWFQIHPWQEMIARQTVREKHLEWLANTKIPVYLEEEHPDDVPTGERYPYEGVCLDLGIGDYLTSALAFMFALAIFHKYDEIRIYGLDMSVGTEYFAQRPCMEFLAGIATSRGIKVWVPDSCPLFKGERYAKTANIDSATVATLQAEFRQRKVRLKDEANAVVGALNRAKSYLENPDTPQAVKDFIGPDYERDLTEYKDKLAQFHSAMGAEEVCEQLVREALKGNPVTIESVLSVAVGQGTNYHPEILDGDVVAVGAPLEGKGISEDGEFMDQYNGRRADEV